MNTIVSILCALGITLLSLGSPSFAYDIDAYAEPIYMGSYISDLDKFFNNTLPRNGWSHKKGPGGERMAVIEYKGFAIKVMLLPVGDTIKMKLISAAGENCSQDCARHKKVQGWLLKLRKLIAREITEQARDQMLKD